MGSVDLILIVIFIISGVIGYFKGFFKELYSLIILIVSILLALLFKDVVYDLLISKINFKSFFYLDIHKNMIDLVMNMIGPLVSLILIFSISMFNLKIIRFILIKTNVIPISTDRFRYLGSIIKLFRTAIIFSIIAFSLSFTTLIPDNNIYKDSYILKTLLKINVPLKNMSDDIHDIYYNIKDLTNELDNFKDNPSPENIESVINVVKGLRKTGILNDDVIVSGSKILVDELKKDNQIELDASNVQFDAIEDEFKKNEYYPVFKELFNEQIITPELIEKIAKENNIKGINSSNIETLFD